jgi:hypothetical protein
MASAKERIPTVPKGTETVRMPLVGQNSAASAPKNTSLR